LPTSSCSLAFKPLIPLNLNPIRAKQRTAARVSQQDAKRQKMRADLEQRERGEVRARTELETAQMRLKKELETLRARAAQRERGAAAARAAAALSAAAARSQPASTSRPAPSADALLLQRTLKASWSLEARTYDADALRTLFSAVGAVEDVRLFPAKRRGRGSALVVMATIPGAQAAAAGVGEGPACVAARLLPAESLAEASKSAAADASDASASEPAGARPHAAGGGRPLFPSASWSTRQSSAAPTPSPPAPPATTGSFPAGFSSFPTSASTASVPSSFPPAAAAPAASAPAASEPAEGESKPPLAGVSHSSWHAAVAKSRTDEVQRQSRRAELLARLADDEED